MRLDSIELENIRSYTKARVDFQEGITLLAGDIGAGKSTILLAIEFALFGLRRGDISGEALLRHGTEQGSVTLTFQLQQKITINRTLKKSSQGVQQRAGYLEIDGQRESLTPTELKARIIELLGYPEDFLNKTKGFVFRYTVYTPQEEMKKILEESDQDRLDTLRSVFGVDKYKQVQENAQKLSKSLRDDIRDFRTRLEDLPELETDLLELQSKQKAFEEKTKELQEKQTVQENVTKRAKEQLESFEKAYQEEQKRKQEIAKLEQEQKSIEQQLITYEKERTQLQKQNPVNEIDNPKPLFEQLREKERQVTEKLAQANAKLQSIAEQKRKLDEQKQNINQLTTCPVCKQDVKDDHKSHITKDIQSQEKLLEDQEADIQEKKSKIQKIQDQLLEKRQTLEHRQTLYEKFVQATEQAKHAKMRDAQIEGEKRTLQQRIKQVQARLKELSETSFPEETYQEAKKASQKASEELAVINQELAVQKAKQEANLSQQGKLQEKIKTKNGFKVQLQKLQKQEQWLSKQFLTVTQIIEKHVMASIRNEFGRRFTQWFDQLLEDDSCFAQLTETFAPTITQDGYDQNISHLSGGEKTSVALAYRLALNSVINDYVRTMKTTDLLILDEPTDGFSSQQLDRVRDVLNNLSAKQIIIVSHEQKMESFVDRVIHIVKNEARSQAA